MQLTFVEPRPNASRRPTSQEFDYNIESEDEDKSGDGDGDGDADSVRTFRVIQKWRRHRHDPGGFQLEKGNAFL